MELPFAVGKDHESGHMPNIRQKVQKITKPEIEQSIMCRVKAQGWEHYWNQGPREAQHAPF